MSKTVPFQTIQISISTQFKCKYSLIVRNISISSYSVQHKYAVRSIQPIDRALSGATTPSQSGPGSDGVQQYWNLIIRLFSVISRILIEGGAYPSAEKQSVYSTAPADWSILNVSQLTEFDLYRDIVLIVFIVHTKILYLRLICEDIKKGRFPRRVNEETNNK